MLSQRGDRARHWLSARVSGLSSAFPPMVGAALTACGVCGLLVLFVWPLITDSNRLMGDALADAALIGQQGEALRAGFLPSHFTHSDSGIFNAAFAFYGGTLFALAGAIAVLVGSPVAAEAVVYILALAAAYGGWLWMARMAGLRSWVAHAPALLYVTAPYVITNVAVRQDLTESVATAAIPLLLASALSVLRADRLRAGPAAALAASTIVIGGTHNLTLLWAATILGLTLPLLIAGLPEARRMITRAGLLRVLAVVVPAMAVNAWYLFPDLAYHTHTLIAHRIDEWRASVRSGNPSIHTKYLFSVNRTSAFPGSAFSAALPVLAIAWVLLATAVLVRRQWRQAWARALLILAVTSMGVVVVMMHPRLITALPDPWLMIQYSYRLETFALFGICGAVIAALALLERGGHRWLTALLLPILVFSVLSALGQVRDVPREAEVAWTIDSFNTLSTGDYADASLKPRPGEQAPIVVYTRVDVDQDRLDATADAQPGEIIYSDLLSIAPMLDIQGAKVVGRWAEPLPRTGWQPRWFLALRIDDDATPGKAHITVREARTLPIVAGRIVSLLGLLGLVAVAAAIVRGRRRAGNKGKRRPVRTARAL
jgi:hypothetical protein